MNMEGFGIEHAISIASVCGVIVAAIFKAPTLFNGHGYMTEKLCKERHGNLQNKVNEISVDVKALLKHHRIAGDDSG